MNAALAILSSKSRVRLESWSAGLVLAILGGAFLVNVAPYWQVNPQYSYGWLVPAFAAILFHRRWTCRPAPAAATPAPANGLLALLALLFLPIWLIVQPNP